MSAESQLKRLAKKHGVEIKDCGNGHIQIRGKLLVNYYPESARRTAYVAGTKTGVRNCSYEQAIKMALQPPPVAPGKTKHTQQTSAKRRMLAKKPYCHWCGRKLSKEMATVDHVIPLSRGGLNNANNKVLACGPCNKARANNMPEINGPDTFVDERETTENGTPVNNGRR